VGSLFNSLKFYGPSLTLLGITMMACFYVYSVMASLVSSLITTQHMSHVTVGWLQVMFCVGSTGPVLLAGRLADTKNTRRLGIFLGMAILSGTILAIIGVWYGQVFWGMAISRLICGFAIEALVVVIMTLISSTLPTEIVPFALGINLAAGRFGSVLAHWSGAWTGTGPQALWNASGSTVLVGFICVVAISLYFQLCGVPNGELRAFKRLGGYYPRGLNVRFWTATSAAAAFYGAFYAFEVFSQHYLRTVIHISPTKSSYLTGLMLATSALAAPLFARYANTLRGRQVLMASGGIGLTAGLIMIGMSTTAKISSLSVAVGIVGLAGAAFPAAFWPHIVLLTPKDIKGIALAFVTVVQQTITGIAILLFAYAADKVQHNAALAIGVCIGFSILSVILLLTGRRKEENQIV